MRIKNLTHLLTNLALCSINFLSLAPRNLSLGSLNHYINVTDLTSSCYQILKFANHPFYLTDLLMDDTKTSQWSNEQGKISQDFIASFHQIANSMEGNHFCDFCGKFLQANFVKGIISGLITSVSEAKNMPRTLELTTNIIQAMDLYLKSNKHATKPISFDDTLTSLLTNSTATNSINIQSDSATLSKILPTTELSIEWHKELWKHPFKLHTLLAQADKNTLTPYISIHQSVIEILDQHREKVPKDSDSKGLAANYAYIIKNANNPSLASSNLYPIRWLENFDAQLAIDLFQTWPQTATISELAKHLYDSGKHDRLQEIADSLASQLKTNPEYINIIDALSPNNTFSTHLVSGHVTQNNRIIPTDWKDNFNKTVLKLLCSYSPNFQNLFTSLIYVVNSKTNGRKIIQKALDDLSQNNQSKSNIQKYTKQLNFYCIFAGVPEFQPTESKCVIQ